MDRKVRDTLDKEMRDTLEKQERVPRTDRCILDR